MSRRLTALLAFSALAVAGTVVTVGVAERSSPRVAPRSSFNGKAVTGSSGGFTGVGNAGGGGGDEGGGFGGGDDGAALGVLSSGPGGALSSLGVAAVRQLQTDLARLGYFQHAVTGYYGVVTTAAVKKFQRSAGIKADGIWGQGSATALQKRLAGG